MADPFIGEIRLFAGTYAPQGWLACDGSLVQISENEVLYTLLGTIYGGDGVRTFALPDLRNRLPVGQGGRPCSVATRRWADIWGGKCATDASTTSCA
jgi:microcystin-dependent protein